MPAKPTCKKADLLKKKNLGLTIKRQIAFVSFLKSLKSYPLANPILSISCIW